MAKKKQKRGSDKRGYSQGPAATNNAPTSATAAAPASAKQSSSQSSPSKQQAQGQQLLPTLSTLKFQNKLATITTTLQSLTFSPNQIEKVVLALQYDITLEKSLDWLCLNYYNLEEGDDNLPCLFVDGSVRLLFQKNDDNDSCEEEERRMKLSVVKTVHRAVEQDDDDDDCYGRKENNILNVDGTNDGHVDDERINKKQEMDQMKKQQEEEEQRVKEEEEEEEERKNWLLQRYEYEEDDDDDYGDDKNKNAITNNSEQEQQQQEEEEEQSPEETLLHQQETKLHLLEADLNNDANNYMRSKFEMKQLQNEVKKMRQMVNGLRRKVERGKKAEESRRREEEVEMQQQQQQVEEEEEEGNGPMFDLFGNSNDDDEEGEGCDDNEVTPNQAASSTPTTSAITPTTPTKQLDYTIPISWTGTTPQKKLDEVLKKQQLPHAKYTKLPMNAGFKLTITTLLDTDSDKNTTNSTKKKKKKKQQPQTIVKQYEANHRDYTKTSSLKDHLATLALYELDPSLPLYSVFPGPFRELWLSWMNEVREKREMEQKEVEGEKKAYIDHLIGLIEKVRIEQRGEGGGGEKGDVLSEKVDTITKVDDDGSGEVVDDWEDEEVEDDVAVRITASKDPSTTGMRLQKEFTKRMSTPSYQTMKAVRDTLPMLQYRQNILDTVKDHPVVIVQADTGAGKSTQCGQYILEQALIDGMGDAVNMICTQPRRVAATSVAERVADEMVESLGNMVGYQIRMESRRSSRTKLLFCTTGVVLRRLQDDPNLTGVTHVIVDEVHERQQQTDVLLIVLRQLLQTTRPDLKVILMSATMDEKLFCSFFHGAPLVSVPGRTFPVNNYYLEDLLEATNHLIEESSRYALRDTYRGEKTQMMITTRGGEKRKQMVDCHDNPLSMELDESFYPGFKLSTRLSLWRVNEEAINYDLVEDVLMLLLVKQDYSALAPPDGADMSSKGSILIFLPGLGEIKALAERLGGNRHFRSCDVIPMHSTLSSKDQRRAFTPALSRRTKIILGTNICETSITLPDVVCVIDCGRVRQVTRNKRTGGSMLIQQWCAKSSCKQRAGRAGRVQPGMCLKLYSSNTAEYIMKAESEPELRRVPLEEVCMSILASGFSQNCMQFLSQAPQPPSIDSVRAAVEVLHQVGAVEAGNEIERLTPLGLHLAKLPVDVRIAKMMIFGVLFCSIDPVLTIAASLSSKSPFAEFFNDDGTAKAKQKQFMDPDSDFITYVNVWEAYSKAAEISPSAARKFCKENYLNFVALREIGDSRRQFLDLLCSIGFLDKSDAAKLKQSAFNRHARKHELVHAVCAAGFYPNIARLDQSPAMDISLWHNNERIYFHGKSVNASKKRFQSSDKWIVFHEKFGTTHRTSVATTAFVHPFVLCLFGSSVVVKHTERKVLVDGWMELRMAAQVGVFLREVRNQLDLLLQEVFEHSDKKRIEKMDNDVIEGIVGILSAECA
ncbi:hypothetical protein ACHAWT_004152 [Skeletonema menzelii]